MESISVLILILFFLLIENEFDLKITLRILNPENQSSILIKIRKMLLLSKLVIVSISLPVSIENKENRYKLFVYSCNIFPVIELNILSLYNNFNNIYAWFRPRAFIYIICQKIFYYFLPWILKLIVDMIKVIYCFYQRVRRNIICLFITDGVFTLQTKEMFCKA